MHAGATALIVASNEVFGVGLKRILDRRRGWLQVQLVPVKRLGSYLDKPIVPVALLVIEAEALAADGRGLLSALRARCPDVRILVAAAPGGREEILEHLSLSVHGVIFRTQTVREILRAVQIVVRGGIFVPASCSDAIVQGAPAENISDAAMRWSEQVRPAARLAAPLSSRQKDVVRLLARGLSNKQIARELGLAEATVKVHLNFAFKALNVHNRAGAVAAAIAAELASEALLESAAPPAQPDLDPRDMRSPPLNASPIASLGLQMPFPGEGVARICRTR